MSVLSNTLSIMSALNSVAPLNEAEFSRLKVGDVLLKPNDDTEWKVIETFSVPAMVRLQRLETASYPKTDFITVAFDHGSLIDVTHILVRLKERRPVQFSLSR